MAFQSDESLITANRGQLAIRTHGHIRSNSGTVTTDVVADQALPDDIQLFGDHGKNHANADASTVGDLVGSGRGGGGGDPIAEGATERFDLVVSPPGLEYHFCDEVRSEVGGNSIRAGSVV